MENNKTWLTQWLIKSLYGVYLVAFLTLVGYVVANDQQSRERDVQITEKNSKQIAAAKDKIDIKLEKILQEIMAVKLEIERLKK